MGGVIGQVALKDSRFNRYTDLTGLSSARKLARKLFSALSIADPPRTHLVVEGAALSFKTYDVPTPIDLSDDFPNEQIFSVLVEHSRYYEIIEFFN